MADYYPLIARAIGGLPDKSGEARKAVYERARRALLAQLTAVDPPLSEADVAREQQALENAIGRIEADYAGAPAPTVRPPVPTPPPPSSPTPPVARPAPPPPIAPSASPASVSVPAPERPAEPAAGFHPTEAEAVAAGLEPARSAGAPSDWRSEAARLVREREAAEAAAVAQVDSAEEEPPVEEPAEEEAVPRRGWGRLVGTLVFVLLLIAGGVVGYMQREAIVGLIRGGGPSAPSQTAQAPEAPVRSDAPKSTDRIAQAAEDAAPATSSGATSGADSDASVSSDQRAVLFEESPGGGEQGLQQYVGSVVWSTESASASDGQPADMGVRADISIPARNISATLTFRRNQDPTIPASHIIEVQFKLPPGFDLGNISSVPGMRAKASEGAQGAPLVGLAVRVAPNYFLIGLSSLDADIQRNLSFIVTRNWLDLPLVFENGRRAILVLEKGKAGNQAFRQAFSAWGLPVGPAQPANAN